MTPPNTSPLANTNTVTEEKSVKLALDTNEVTHDFQYYSSRYCCKSQGPEHQEHARRQLLEYLQVGGPPHQDQLTHAYVEGLQIGSPKQTTAAKDHQSNEEEIIFFALQLHPESGPKK